VEKGVVREHQFKKKVQPLPNFKKSPTSPFLSKEKQRKKGGGTKVLTLKNIWPWVPAALDARSDRAGCLPAISYCSALPCHQFRSEVRRRIRIRRKRRTRDSVRREGFVIQKKLHV
jgi:hypothetical protein